MDSIAQRYKFIETLIIFQKVFITFLEKYSLGQYKRVERGALVYRVLVIRFQLVKGDDLSKKMMSQGQWTQVSSRQWSARIRVNFISRVCIIGWKRELLSPFRKRVNIWKYYHHHNFITSCKRRLNFFKNSEYSHGKWQKRWGRRQ